MKSIDEFAVKSLIAAENKGCKRVIRQFNRAEYPYIKTDDGRILTSFSCNDYLGLTQNHEIKSLMISAINEYGTGAGASRLVTGSCPLYGILEDRLAKLKGYEASLVAGSGYLANLAAITSLVSSGDIIILDKLSHACMIDAAILSGAKIFRYQHNDIAHLENILKNERYKYNKCLIVTESVFSMDGDKADIDNISNLAKNFDAWLLVDDAHNLDFGCSKADILVGTLSKTFASYGGYICSSKVVKDYFINSARSIIFTTALPSSALAAAIGAVQYIEQNPSTLKEPLRKAKMLESIGLKVETQIVPIIIGEATKTVEISRKLEEYGFLVSAIRPPTVPANTSRLRLAFSASHNDDDIVRFCNTLQEFLLS